MTITNVMFLKQTAKFFLIPFLIVFLSSCSSLSSMKFWGNDEIDLDEPRSLQDISNIKSIKTNWELSFSGENYLGNFVPAFSADNIFFADSTGQIKSFNSSQGKVNWEKKVNSLSSGISSGFGMLVVADTDGNIISLDQADGSILWSVNVKGEVLAPSAISSKFVIVKTGSGELIALDKSNGEILWSYRSKLPTLTIRGSSSPVIVDNKVYVSFDNGRLTVFELDSGFPVWDGAISYVSGTSELENLIDSDSNPIVEGGLVYTTNYQGNINIFDIAQKRSVWQAEASSFYSPLLIKGLIVLVESGSNMKSYSTKTLQESWNSNEFLNRQLSNPIAFDGSVMIGDFEGYIHIIDPLNGKPIGRKKISKKPIKMIISRSKNFYAVDESFNLFSLSI
ncbi:outer membrane protein assembly factor BamB [Gammaproteobacteria bacterium]|jgi:outer membrane protein assembly factor BamB|nr:outer membrane protein assembly factor BamB [Gammaproteobacteria bacterium]MDB2489124.1 outer membrane protein assembly factor BamB [Gammaproteobacteria bacterium]